MIVLLVLFLSANTTAYALTTQNLADLQQRIALIRQILSLISQLQALLQRQIINQQPILLPPSPSPLQAIETGSLDAYTLPPGPPASVSMAIFSITPSEGIPGTVVMITGRGFTTSNRVYVGGTVLENVASTDGQILTFTIPTDIFTERGSQNEIPSDNSTSSTGASTPFWIYLENASGLSNEIIFNAHPWLRALKSFWPP